jgi:hypothetical protein
LSAFVANSPKRPFGVKGWQPDTVRGRRTVEAIEPAGPEAP